MEATASLEGHRRSLLPREHGAYAQIGLPLATALLAGRPSVAGVSFTLAACAAFTAHEPLLIVLGQRGRRALREDGARAGRRLALTLAVSLASAALAFAVSPSLLLWAAVPLGLAVVTFGFVARRIERSLAGEIVASAALSATALPVAIAGGLAPRVALACPLVFFLGSLLSTVEVRAIARREAASLVRVAAWVTFGAALLALAVELPRFALTTLPTSLVLIVVAATRPRPARLRTIGWFLASAFMVTAVAFVVAARLG